MTEKGAGIMAAAELVKTTAPLSWRSSICFTKWCVSMAAAHALHSMLHICVSIDLRDHPTINIQQHAPDEQTPAAPSVFGGPTGFQSYDDA